MKLQYRIGKLELDNMELEQSRIVHESAMRGKDLTIQKLQLQVGVQRDRPSLDGAIHSRTAELMCFRFEQAMLSSGINPDETHFGSIGLHGWRTDSKYLGSDDLIYLTCRRFRGPNRSHIAFRLSR